MTDDRDNQISDSGAARKTRRVTTPVRLRPPETVPISKEDYEQAITALSTMILDWWKAQQENRKPE